MYTLGSEARNPLYIGWWLLKLDRAHFRIRGAREGPSCWLMDLEDWVKRQRWFLHSNVVVVVVVDTLFRTLHFLL